MAEFSFSTLWDKLLLQKRQALLFVLSPLLAVLLLGVFSFYLRAAIGLYFLLAGLLMLGTWHFLLSNENLAFFSRVEKVVFIMFVAVEVFVCFGIVSLFFHRFSWLTNVAVVCAYLLPFNIGLLWPLFQTISKQNIVPWSYSDELTFNKSTIFLNSIPIHFNVLLPEEEKEQQITFRAPVRMKLGLVFYHMVQEQNSRQDENIQLTNDNQIPYQWVFYTHHLLGWHKNLDPEKSFLENGIRQKSKIFATRIPAPQPVETSLPERC